MNISATIRAAAAACLLGVALLGTPAHADAAPADGHTVARRDAQPLCDFHFFTGSPYFEHDAIIAGGYADCTQLPDEFHVDLLLSYRARGGDWSGRNAADSNQLPDPRLNIATWSACEPGMWKASAKMWETVGGKTVQHSTESNSFITGCGK
ncbi:hypothetical protein [Nocardia nova]